MYCTQFEQYIHDRITEEEYDLHLAGCTHCQAMNARFEEAWSLLDDTDELPSDMVEKILARKTQEKPLRARRFDLSMITQIAAVLVAGIFLGITLGRHSDPNLLLSKEMKKQQSLIDFRNDHFFQVEKELFY